MGGYEEGSALAAAEVYEGVLGGRDGEGGYGLGEGGGGDGVVGSVVEVGGCAGGEGFAGDVAAGVGVVALVEGVDFRA